MFWEGFLRSLASDFWAGVGTLFIAAVVYVLGSVFVRNYLDGDPKALKVIRAMALGISLFVVLALFGRAASVSFANRMPRNDVDKSSVYEQMDSHGQDNKDRK